MAVDWFGTKNIEEVKPNIYVKKDPKGRYRSVDPIFLDGKFNFWAFIRRWWTFVIIIILVWGYIHDTQELRKFHEEFANNPTVFCANRVKISQFGNPDCTIAMEEFGLCQRSLNLTLG